jgi:type IV pilus assembly protein PilM
MNLSFKKIKNRLTKETYSFGLDIGTSAIKLVKLKFSKDIIELCNFELAQTEIDLEQLIKKIVQSQNAYRVNIAVSGPATIIRYISFPKMNNDELKKSLRFEAQKYIPFPITELNLDSYILKENLPENKMFLLLAAVKSEFMNQRLKLMESCGLKINVFDIDSIALINAFNFNYPQEDASKQKTTALLNIGASLSNLNVLEGDVPHLSRDIQIAGIKFTQKLVDVMGLDFKSAENLKLNPESDKADKITKAIESVLANLAAEIRTSFDYYESQSSSTVAKIFLSGGGSLFPGLKDMLAGLLGIEVEYWDPLKKISISESLIPEKLKLLSPQLAVAIGLALRQ